MPKKILPGEEFEDEDAYEDDEDDEEDEEEYEDRGDYLPPKKMKSKKTVTRVKKAAPKNEVVSKRYEPFHQQEIIGVRDAETGEIVAQGFKDIGSAMIGAEQLDRLEQIQTAIGVMQ